MTFFSRCDASQFAEAAARRTSPRRSRTGEAEGGLLRALSGFAEDIGILVRYAAGLDYYGRGKIER